MSLIDLGEVGHTQPGEVPRRSPGRRPDKRWLVLGALLVLPFATMAGGAPRPGPLPEATIPARLGAQTVAAGTRLFVIDPAERLDPSGVPAPPSIAAHRLPDGRPLWRAPLPVTRTIGGGLIDSRIVGETLVVSGSTGPGSDAPQEVAGVDAATGALRWRGTGYAMGAATGDQVLLTLRTEPQGQWTFVGLDPDTGALRWSLPRGADVAFVQDDDREHVRSLVTITPPRRVEVRDPATGEVVRSAELAGERFDPEHMVHVVAGLLLVHDEQRLTAYGIDTLDRRWTAPVNRAEGSYATACGPLICQWLDDGGVRVLDPRDGRTRWSDPRWSMLEAAGSHFVASADAWACRIGPICRDRPGPPVRFTVLDRETGRALGDLGVWQWIDWTADGAGLVAMRTDVKTGRAEIARLDPAALTARPLAVLDKVSGQCGVAEGALFCRRRDASVGVWQLTL